MDRATPIMPITVENSASITGQWSVTDLATLPVNATVGVLSRYMAGRVNPYCGVVGELLCSKVFQLSQNGHRNIEKAVSSLQAVGSLGNVLEFGFGMEDLVRLMAKSESGCACIALCAALKDTFSDDVAVETLLELARLSKVEGQWMPSGLEWKNLLSACAGALATSSFAPRAEFLMRLVGGERSLGGISMGIGGRPRSVRACSTPSSIAQALSMLGRITRKDLEAVTFVGGADVGWLAAVAEWFLDLRVAVVRTDGELQYTNCNELDTIQVQIIRSETAAGSSSQALQSIGKTFRLDDVSRLFEAEMRTPSDAVVSGRLEWKEALSCTFQVDFKRLLNDSQVLGELIGSAARLFKALAQGHTMFSADSSLKTLPLKACVSYNDESYGKGFVNHIVHWFPELRKLGEIMSKAASKKLEEARRTYDHCIALIKEICGCRICKSAEGTLFGDDAETDADGDREMTPALDNSDSSDDFTFESIDGEEDNYCLVAISETIIVLGRALANVSVTGAKDLFPKRSGFELAYGKQANLRYLGELNGKGSSTMGQIKYCLDVDKDLSLNGRVDGEEAAEVRLQILLELFTGRDAPVIATRTTAICRNGICVFQHILAEPSVDSAVIGRIHVLPGRIQYEKKSYDRVEDNTVLRDDEQDFLKSAKIAECEPQFGNPTLIIKESSAALQCLLDLRPLTGDAIDPIRVGPGRLATLLSSRRGLVHCQTAVTSRRHGSKACKLFEMGKQNEVDQARTQSAKFVIGDKTFDVLRFGSQYSALLSLASATYLDPSCVVYIAEEECLDCCIRAVIEANRPEKKRVGIFFIPKI